MCYRKYCVCITVFTIPHRRPVSSSHWYSYSYSSRKSMFSYLAYSHTIARDSPPSNSPRCCRLPMISMTLETHTETLQTYVTLNRASDSRRAPSVSWHNGAFCANLSDLRYVRRVARCASVVFVCHGCLYAWTRPSLLV